MRLRLVPQLRPVLSVPTRMQANHHQYPHRVHHLAQTQCLEVVRLHLQVSSSMQHKSRGDWHTRRLDKDRGCIIPLLLCGIGISLFPFLFRFYSINSCHRPISAVGKSIGLNRDHCLLVAGIPLIISSKLLCSSECCRCGTNMFGTHAYNYKHTTNLRISVGSLWNESVLFEVLMTRKAYGRAERMTRC